MGQAEFTVSSRVAAPADAVWERVSTFAGVNHELMPVCRMTAPKHLRALTPETVTLGERVARCWILALGFIPIDYDDLVLVRIEPGRGFLERSTMLTQDAVPPTRTSAPS